MKFHLSLFILLSIVACAPAAEEAVEGATTTEADLEAISEVRGQEMAAINAGNVEGFLTILTEDVIAMPPNEPAIIGKDAVESWLQNLLDQFAVQADYTASDIVVAGDWAFEHFSGDWTLTPKAGGEPIAETFKGIHIYQRQPDGSWKIAWDTWNSDNPPAGQ